MKRPRENLNLLMRSDRQTKEKLPKMQLPTLTFGLSFCLEILFENGPFSRIFIMGEIFIAIFFCEIPLFQKSSYMAFFPCHLKKFPYNFQRKKIIRNTWKIKLYICPPDSSAF